MARLPHDAVDAGRVSRPQDRADVVRIFDAVEYDDEGRGSGARDEILNAECARVARVGDDALVHAALCRTIQIARRHTPDGDVLAFGRLDHDRAASRRHDPKRAARAPAPREAPREPG